MSAVLAVMRREWWINTRAYRLSFFGAALMNAVFTLLAGRVLFSSVFGGAVTPTFVARAGTGDYMTFLTLGVLANSYAFRLLYPVRNVLEEHQEGTLAPLRMTGIGSAAFQLGCVGFSACYAFVELVVVMAATLPWSGASFGNANVVAIVVTLLAALPGLLGFSTLLSGIVLVVRDRLVVESVAFTLMALLGGVAFPAQYLPRALQLLGELLPLTWMLRMLRAAALADAPVASLLPGVAALLVLGAAHFAAGLLILRRAIPHALSVST